ncbi:hypothetical protein Tco_1361292 [Tanacetum coccineum]
MHITDKSRDDFQKYTRYYTHIFKDTMIRDIAAIGKYLIEAILHEHEIQKRLEHQSNDFQINSVQALEASLVVTESSRTESENSSSETTFSRSENEHTSFDKESSLLDYIKSSSDIHEINENLERERNKKEKWMITKEENVTNTLLTS